MRTRRDVLKKILMNLGLLGGFRLTGLGHLLVASGRKIVPPGTRIKFLPKNFIMSADGPAVRPGE
jgi:hypothetical protein